MDAHLLCLESKSYRQQLNRAYLLRHRSAPSLDSRAWLRITHDFSMIMECREVSRGDDKPLAFSPYSPSCRALWYLGLTKRTCSLSRRHDDCTNRKPCS